MIEDISSDSVETMKRRIELFSGRCARIKQEVAKVIVGHEEAIDGILTAILTGGHVLLEGVPGIGKTLLVKTFSRVCNLSFSRIQFTPDLMPADVTGTMILEDTGTGRHFKFSRGPIFANLVLADEINRATPKTQSALLEAMQEKRVTVMGETHQIELPFVVLATQNPIEMEGTYPLPEAQLDRFLFKIMLSFPSIGEIERVVERTTVGKEVTASKVIDSSQLDDMIELVRDMKIENRSVISYSARIVNATHPQSSHAPEMVKKYVRYGASPRGAQALVWGGKVRALMGGRVVVDFDDIGSVIKPALRHRIILNFEGESQNINPDHILEQVVESVPEVL